MNVSGEDGLTLTVSVTLKRDHPYLWGVIFSYYFTSTHIYTVQVHTLTHIYMYMYTCTQYYLNIAYTHHIQVGRHTLTCTHILTSTHHLRTHVHTAKILWTTLPYHINTHEYSHSHLCAQNYLNITYTHIHHTVCSYIHTHKLITSKHTGKEWITHNPCSTHVTSN